MRAINFLIFFIFLNSCATMEVAEVFTKTSIKVVEGVSSKTTANIKSDEKEKNENDKSLSDIKKEISKEKQISKATSNKQRKVSNVILLGKSLVDLSKEIGDPILIREDGNTKTVRYDTSSCRLFLYFNKSMKKEIVEHYEIRNINGDLIDKKENINRCFNEIKKV
tara:strand:- start:1239 stop:1736 length:498 start_codon:yes stop_codon:yes gene_type:complete